MLQFYHVVSSISLIKYHPPNLEIIHKKTVTLDRHASLCKDHNISGMYFHHQIIIILLSVLYKNNKTCLKLAVVADWSKSSCFKFK